LLTALQWVDNTNVQTTTEEISMSEKPKVYVGYIVYESAHGDHGIPCAAGIDHDTVFSNTFRRLTEIYAGHLLHCHDMIAVRECDITESDAQSIEALVAAHWSKHRIGEVAAVSA